MTDFITFKSESVLQGSMTNKGVQNDEKDKSVNKKVLFNTKGENNHLKAIDRTMIMIMVQINSRRIINSQTKSIAF